MALLQSRWRVLLLFVLLYFLLLVPMYPLIQSYYQEELERKHGQSLDLISANLISTLQRYEVLPHVLGLVPEVQQALLQPQPEQLQTANLLFDRIRAQTGADVIYLLDIHGNTLAASNWDQPFSFVGNNFAFRPYFYDALARGKGEFFGLGNISIKRGYYYGSAVEHAGQVIGVLVVKVDLDFTETLWGEAQERLLVTDKSGVVILSSLEDWRFKATRPLTAAEQQSIARHQPYSSIDPQMLQIRADSWLQLTNELPSIDWQVSVLIPRQQIIARLQTTMAVFAASLLAILLLFGLLLQRRHHYLERLAIASKARELLEQRVERRTRDLQTLNDRLKAEVLEREATEQKLVRTQDELVQAGKLTALGVMSASISHELNQPLAAMRSYTDNAKILLQQQRLPEVAGNLELMGQLTGRMASIISHLRAFARRDPKASEHVALQPALEDALALHAKQLQRLQVEVRRDVPEATLWVEAGETRLRQVLGNLLSNALDALAGQPSPRTLWLHTRLEDGWLCLNITDNGPGFSAEALAQAREPFFTTKTTTSGLGLGLAICEAIVKSFGGRLEFANRAEGGAMVSLYLKPIAAAAQPGPHEDRFA